MQDLMTENVRLRALQTTDIQEIAELCNNKKIWDNVRDMIPFPYTEADASNFLVLCRQEKPPCTFAIEFDRRFVGCIGLVRQVDVYQLTAEIGYWIGEPFWGKGIATNAVQLAVNYGFNNLKLVRIYAGVFANNVASQRVLEKSGFKFECIFESSILKNGIIGDEYRYAIIRKT